MPDVRVVKDEGLQWEVWLDGTMVGHYTVLSDALNYASLLECDPRERALALAS
jgi:glycyl-tRNA synthetase alpha subunit